MEARYTITWVYRVISLSSVIMEARCTITWFDRVISLFRVYIAV